MKVFLKNAEFPQERLRASVLHILESTKLCSIATTGPDGNAHINTAFFCYTDALEVYFISDTATKHSQNIARSPSIAFAVYDSHQPWGEHLRGLQLFGECHLASALESIKALTVHAARFRAYGDYIKSLSPLELSRSPYRFYLFRPTSMKILDESEFGEETFVTVEVVRN